MRRVSPTEMDSKYIFIYIQKLLNGKYAVWLAMQFLFCESTHGFLPDPLTDWLAAGTGWNTDFQNNKHWIAGKERRTTGIQPIPDAAFQTGRNIPHCANRNCWPWSWPGRRRGYCTGPWLRPRADDGERKWRQMDWKHRSRGQRSPCSCTADHSARPRPDLARRWTGPGGWGRGMLPCTETLRRIRGSRTDFGGPCHGSLSSWPAWNAWLGVRRIRWRTCPRRKDAAPSNFLYLGAQVREGSSGSSHLGRDCDGWNSASVAGCLWSKGSGSWWKRRSRSRWAFLQVSSPTPLWSKRCRSTGVWRQRNVASVARGSTFRTASSSPDPPRFPSLAIPGNLPRLWSRICPSLVRPLGNDCWVAETEALDPGVGDVDGVRRSNGRGFPTSKTLSASCTDAALAESRITDLPPLIRSYWSAFIPCIYEEKSRDLGRGSSDPLHSL